MIDIVKKQYVYKLRAYTQVFISLIFIQLLAILFSLNGVGMMGSSSTNLKIEVHYYSADLVVGFTMLWGFITAILITTKVHRNIDFPFVTNRLSSNLSNLLFLLTVSFAGGMTAVLSIFPIKLIMYYLMDSVLVKSVSIVGSPFEFLLGIFTTTFYVFLFCAIGYFVGTLVQINKVFAGLLPGLFLGSLYFDGVVRGKDGVVAYFFQLIFSEPSLPLFMIKVIIIAGLFLIGSFTLSNRMEVRQ
jgi:hypothetical protein